MPTLRAQWVKAKATAAKANGGKDPWKQHKLKDRHLGPACDAFEAVFARWEAFLNTYDKTKAADQVKRAKFIAAMEKAMQPVAQAYKNYEIEIKGLVSRDLVGPKVLEAIQDWGVHMYRAGKQIPKA